MKPVNIERSPGLDRLATWNEVRCAMLFSSKGDPGLDAACDHFLGETDSDLNGRACSPPEEIAWLAIVREMPDSLSN